MASLFRPPDMFVPIPPRVVVNLYWEITHGQLKERRLISVMRPTQLSYLPIGDGSAYEFNVTVEKVPEWLHEPPPPKKLSDVEQLRKSLAGEPWTTMMAYADALQDAGGRLAYGWMMIAQAKLWPMKAASAHGSFAWPSAYLSRWPGLWRHDSISRMMPEYVYTRSPGGETPREDVTFVTVESAWQALAYAWTEMDAEDGR